MSDRPEPVLQPMRVVQVPDTAPKAKPEGDVPRDAKGKKIVRSKKEIEAEKLQASKPKHSLLQESADIRAANQQIIRNLEPNAKIDLNANQNSEADLAWLEEVGGKPVQVAWLQTGVSVSGYLSSETSFSSDKIRGLTMSWQPDGLLCKIERAGKEKITLLIPAANVKAMVL